MVTRVPGYDTLSRIAACWTARYWYCFASSPGLPEIATGRLTFGCT
jgi:hypothetical protein